MSVINEICYPRPQPGDRCIEGDYPCGFVIYLDEPGNLFCDRSTDVCRPEAREGEWCGVVEGDEPFRIPCGTNLWCDETNNVCRTATG